LKLNKVLTFYYVTVSEHSVKTPKHRKINSVVLFVLSFLWPNSSWPNNNFFILKKFLTVSLIGKSKVSSSNPKTLLHFLSIKIKKWGEDQQTPPKVVDI